MLIVIFQKARVTYCETTFNTEVDAIILLKLNTTPFIVCAMAKYMTLSKGGKVVRLGLADRC